MLEEQVQQIQLEMKAILSLIAGGNTGTTPAKSALAQRAREIYASTQAVSIAAAAAAAAAAAEGCPVWGNIWGRLGTKLGTPHLLYRDM